MSATPFLTSGRVCLTLVAMSTSTICYVADWNETHVKNPRWPPHARFHNGQTMSLGLLLGILTAYYTWRPTRDVVAAKDSLYTAAVLGSLYYVAGISAIFYPGTKWMDPEFGDGAPQRPFFLAHIALAWVGWWLEMKRLG